MFLKGLTLLDIKDVGGMNGKGLTMSHVAARQELRKLMQELRIPKAENAITVE